MSSQLFAAEENSSLSVDRVVPNAKHIVFPNDENIKPRLGSFSLQHYVLMSNELGERWAVVTVQNLSSGNRTFEHGHLMALFANGHRASPESFTQSVKGNESLSLTVNFGQHKFPILSLYVETKD